MDVVAEVDEELIAEVLATATGIPVFKLTEEESARLLRMEDELHKRVIGQEQAIKALSQAIRRTRAGLKDPKRPGGSFIFAGPSGVGKTELSKTLAEFLFGDEDSLIQLDMSEFSEKHTVSRLFGSPPGYVGYEEGGQLTEKVRRKPFSVVLFDEVEKAHPDIFNSLLQILEDGRLTDSQGRVVDFKNTVIIMTTNLGTRDISKGFNLGFAAARRHPDRLRADEGQGHRTSSSSTSGPSSSTASTTSSCSRSCPQDEIVTIVDLMVAKLDERLRDKDMGIELTPGAKALLAKKGYDPVLGARPLRRTIQREIEDVLSEKILFGELTPGQIVLVDAEGEGEAPEVHLPAGGQVHRARRAPGRGRRLAGVASRPAVGRTTPTETIRTLEGVRIVSLLPSATEIVYALGLEDELVGVTFECDEPARARTDKAVVVGGLDTRGMTPGEIDALRSRARWPPVPSSTRLHADALADLAPDLILTQDLCRVLRAAGGDCRGRPGPPGLPRGRRGSRPAQPSTTSWTPFRRRGPGRACRTGVAPRRRPQQRLAAVSAKRSLDLRPAARRRGRVGRPPVHGRALGARPGVGAAGGTGGGRDPPSQVRRDHVGARWRTAGPDLVVVAPCGFHLDGAAARRSGSSPCCRTTSGVGDRRGRPRRPTRPAAGRRCRGARLDPAPRGRTIAAGRHRAPRALTGVSRRGPAAGSRRPTGSTSPSATSPSRARARWSSSPPTASRALEGRRRGSPAGPRAAARAPAGRSLVGLTASRRPVPRR